MDKTNNSRIAYKIKNALEEHSGKYNNLLKPDVLVVTGDFTCSSEPLEFQNALQQLHEIKSSLEIKHFVICPGNHDISWKDDAIDGDKKGNFKFVNYKNFVSSCKDEGILESNTSYTSKELNQLMAKRFMSYSYTEDDQYAVLIIGMNTDEMESEKRAGQGYFGQDQFDICKRLIDTFKKRLKMKKLVVITAFHHHVLPVASVERDTIEEPPKFSLTIDARRALDFFQTNKVDLVIHGHQHQPSLVSWRNSTKQGNLHIVHVSSVGSMTDKREKLSESNRNNFAIYDINHERIKVYYYQNSDDDWDIMEVTQNSPFQIRLSQSPRISHERIMNYVNQNDRWIKKADKMGPLSIKELVTNLIYNIDSDGSVPYEINNYSRYRTSCLATVLECLYDIQLLPLEDVKIMQNKLFKLKDEFIPKDKKIDDIIEKNNEDKPAWGIDEAPSVWTTSKALSALALTNYIPCSEEDKRALEESVIWLSNQAYDNLAQSGIGWGYQKYEKSEACSPNVPMSALAIKALCLCLNHQYVSGNNRQKILSAIKKGITYLDANKEEDATKCVWKYLNAENISVSIWALEAWKLSTTLIEDEFYYNTYHRIREKTLKYAIDNLPKEDDDNNLTECFFQATKEQGLKYKNNMKSDKNFFSFTPFIVSYLIRENNDYVNNENVISVVKWIVAHRNDSWLIPQDYNSNKPCTITVAMAINVIVNWLQQQSTMMLDKRIQDLLDFDFKKNEAEVSEK